MVSTANNAVIVVRSARISVSGNATYRDLAYLYDCAYQGQKMEPV